MATRAQRILNIFGWTVSILMLAIVVSLIINVYVGIVLVVLGGVGYLAYVRLSRRPAPEAGPGKSRRKRHDK